jgi:hypothetical protein
MRYPKQRLLSILEEVEVEKCLNLKVTTKKIREHVVEEFGKPCTLQDIRNVKKRMRKRVNWFIWLSNVHAGSDVSD